MRQLGVFAKYWQPGQVKSRLARTIGPESASHLYLAFLTTTLRRCGNLPGRRVLAYTPPERCDDFSPLAGSDWELLAQCDGDLGLRMQDYFSRSLRSGAEHVLLIGSDSPSLPLSYFDEAYRLLERHQVVLGPADDGGYYLVGIANALPPIFDQIEWSSRHVWQQTVERLTERGISFAALPYWYDIDEVEDLQRLRGELQGRRTLDDASGELRAALEAICADCRQG